jgi:hypothetical protein
VKAHSYRTGHFLYPSVFGALQPQGKPDGSWNGSKDETRAALRAFRLPVIVCRFSHSGEHILAEGLGTEAGEFVILYGKANFDWFAAYFAVLNVALAADG